MTSSRKLSEIAKTIRSKNAGVDKITFDVIFSDRASYDLVEQKGDAAGRPLHLRQASVEHLAREGSGKVGERYVGIVGVRDPYTIVNIDLVTAWRGSRSSSASARPAMSCISPSTAATPFSATESP